jgi:NTP pyrophosphatase (non-canonical NTP hydrolase)
MSNLNEYFKDACRPGILYPDFVRALSKPGQDIVAEITPIDAHRLHMAVGISGEAGELLDAIKKAVIYRKPLDVQNVKEECGDLLFYITGILDSIGTDMDQVISENMEKLSKRYGSLSYSNAHAIQRLDKEHGEEIKGPPPEADEDFDEIIPRTCNLDDEECESCQ